MGLSQKVIQRSAQQGGFVTREQLLAAGFSPSAIDRRVNTGELPVVSAGVYRIYVSDDHADLLRGVMVALPDAVASHQSAAHLLDFPRLPGLDPTVTVPSHTTHRFAGVTVRRSNDVEPSHLTRVHSLRVTNVVRTVFDLAGVLGFPEFETIAESLILADRMKLRHFDGLTNQLARRGKPGSRAARDFIRLRAGADPRSTILERKGRAVLAAARLPAPQAQFPIPWDAGRRFDDAYPRAQLAIEWDSRSWHEQRSAMANDRRRDRLAAAHGWRVVRITWQDIVDNPEEVAANVAAVLRGATVLS